MNITSDTREIAKEKTFGHQLFQKFASFFGKVYATEYNPLYYLGSIAVLLLWWLVFREFIFLFFIM
jgi:uncharacterized membrane protein